MKEALFRYLKECGFKYSINTRSPFTYESNYEAIIGINTKKIDVNIYLEDTFIHLCKFSDYLSAEVYQYYSSLQGIGYSMTRAEEGDKKFKTLAQFSKWCDQRILEGSFLDVETREIIMKKWADTSLSWSITTTSTNPWILDTSSRGNYD